MEDTQYMVINEELQRLRDEQQRLRDEQEKQREKTASTNGNGAGGQKDGAHEKDAGKGGEGEKPAEEKDKKEGKGDDKTDAAKAQVELTETKNPEQSEAAGKGDKSESAKSEGKKSMATTETEDGSLVGDKAVGDVSSAFAKLSTAVKDSAGEPSMTMPAPGRSLEDVVRELLRPILKEWLDTHLPEIVREHVEEEVARISRGRGRA